MELKLAALAMLLCALLCMTQTGWAAYSKSIDLFVVSAEAIRSTCGAEANVRDIMRQNMYKNRQPDTYELTIYSGLRAAFFFAGQSSLRNLY